MMEVQKSRCRLMAGWSLEVSRCFLKVCTRRERIRTMLTRQKKQLLYGEPDSLPLCGCCGEGGCLDDLIDLQV